MPTARHGSFTDAAVAEVLLRRQPGRYVVMTGYLALRKGGVGHPRASVIQSLTAVSTRKGSRW